MAKPPRSFKFLDAVQPLEDAEELARIFHVKPHAVVADVIDDFSCVLLGPTSILGEGFWRENLKAFEEG